MTSSTRTESARTVALEVLRRIEEDGAYANLALGPALSASRLSSQDRGFATDLVYGTTRMRRACDALVDRFVTTEPDPATRRVLRLGAYQLVYAGVAPHAAVGETVGLAPHRTRGFVNAVLRKLARRSDMKWPSEATQLSYPDWVYDTFCAELGDAAVPAMERMNEPPPVTERPDGYIQDAASQWVAAAVAASAEEVVFDMCAAPGGKATVLASSGATVAAGDVRPRRAGLIRQNADRIDAAVGVLVADGSAPPFAAGIFDAVLVDAPCSGLGALRRRADARWRVDAGDVTDLAALQGRLLASAATLVRPGGRLIYSVCTLTAAESIDHATPAGFEVDPAPPDVGEWHPYSQGWRVLPQDADTDGMVLIRYRRAT